MAPGELGGGWSGCSVIVRGLVGRALLGWLIVEFWAFWIADVEVCV